MNTHRLASCSPHLRRGLALGLAVGASLGAGTARAQDAAIDGEFSVQRFNPAPGPRNYYTTRGARHDGKLTWSAGLFANYAYKPFVLRSCIAENDCDEPNAVQRTDIPVVESLFTADLLGSLTILPELQLGLKVPFTYSKGQGLVATGRPDPEGLSGFGVGDAELEGKYRFYGKPTDMIVLAGALFLTGPLGQATAGGAYIGDSSPTVGARVIFDGETGPFGFAFNLGGLYRESGKVGSTRLGSELRYGLAGGYRVSPVFRVILDGFGSTKFSAQNGTNAFELDGGIQILPLGTPLAINLGAGTGLVQGVGVPQVRAFLGVIYGGTTTDGDGDGIPDDKDQCPTQAEDLDGFEDGDGCPDLDNDGDTIADVDDKCPNEAEDNDGFEDTDGCPDPDNDKDGIPDDQDACPLQPETKNGFKDEDGCPDEADRDGDGVPDARDKCPDEPEDTDGFEDTDGCPDPDNDKDGIPDSADECIDEPETKNGFQDEDGCPDVAPKKAGPAPAPPKPLVRLEGSEITILDRVEFATNDSKIVGKKSFEVLDAVVDVLKKHPEIEGVEIGGHTDDRGNAEKNKGLSQRRAESVKKYLVEKGIAAERLTPVGYGQEKPIADNKKADGRQKNRRVEFKITKRKE